MQIRPASLSGVFLIEPERMRDERGWFARTWCRQEFARAGLNTHLAQISQSFNAEAGTLRGLHYQAKPYEETKLVRCTRGRVFDVAVDLRWSSPSFGQWCGVELSAANGRAIYIPAGFAHGFQTLEPDSELLYQISDFYRPEAQRGIRWDDPAIAVDWPAPGPSGRIISARDATLPYFELRPPLRPPAARVAPNA